jgi:transposase-like protein
MADNRRTYSEEFKLEALQKWQEGDKSAADVERELGLTKGSLYRWKRQLGDKLAALSASDTQLVEVGEEEAKQATSEEASAESAFGEAPVEDAADEPVEVAAESQDEVAGTDLETAEEQVPAEEGKEADLPEISKTPSEDQPEETGDITVALTTEEKSTPGPVKRVVKGIFGVLGLVLGAIGILLSLGAIILAWVVNKPITDTGLQLLEGVEQGLTIADQGLNQADSALATTREQLAEVAARFPGEELAARVKNVQVIVDSAQSTADTGATLVGAANSVPLVRRGVPDDQPAAAKLEEASQALTEVSEMLGNVEQRLIEREERGSGPVTQEIDANIADIQARVQRVDSRIEEAMETVLQLQQDLPGLVDLVSIIISLVFVWFGVAQYSLMANGWRWLRHP